MKNSLELKYPETPGDIKSTLIRLQETLNSKNFPERFTKIDALAQKATNEIMAASQVSSKILTKPFTLE